MIWWLCRETQPHGEMGLASVPRHTGVSLEQDRGAELACCCQQQLRPAHEISVSYTFFALLNENRWVQYFFGDNESTV